MKEMVNDCGRSEVGCTNFARTGNKARVIDGRQDGGQVLWGMLGKEERAKYNNYSTGKTNKQAGTFLPEYI